jgi:hypothetical protein
MSAKTLTVTKLDAARSQLRTAIRLWFEEADPVSIHTLAAAAYEIVHVVSKKKGRNRDLLFDALMVKDEYRSDFNKAIKQYASFFKHASRDHDGVLNLPLEGVLVFFIFTIMGLETMGLKHSVEESAFVHWLHLHKPSWLTGRGKDFVDRIPVDQFRDAQLVQRKDFLKAFEATDLGRQLGRASTRA